MRVTKEQGITLIALVITIIVLLILAGVALATLTGNTSIIDNANYSVEEYNKSANEDQNIINKVENLFAKYMGEETKYTITYNVNGGTGTMETQTASRTARNTFTPPEGKQFKEWNTAADGSGTSYAAEATVSSDVTLYAIWYDPLSAHVHVGDYITYNPTLGVTNSSLLSYTSPAGALQIKNGNTYLVNEVVGHQFETSDDAHVLINEDGEVVTTEYTVESDEPGNGYGAQSFTATINDTEWRVLDINESTGVIKIVPQNLISTLSGDEFHLNSLIGYKNAVRELNNISAIFGHGNGAAKSESITLEDVNKLTGYQPGEVSTVIIPGINKPLKNTFIEYGDYEYPGKNPSIIDVVYRDTGEAYWLASRSVQANENYGWDLFVGCVFHEGGEGNYVGVEALWLWKTTEFWYSSDWAHYVMPVVTLKTTVEYKSGNGSQATPWTFQATE